MQQEQYDNIIKGALEEYLRGRNSVSGDNFRDLVDLLNQVNDYFEVSTKTYLYKTGLAFNEREPKRVNLKELLEKIEGVKKPQPQSHLNTKQLREAFKVPLEERHPREVSANEILKIKSDANRPRIPNHDFEYYKTRHNGIAVNEDNFFVATAGLFTEIQSIPNGFELFFKSKTSSYYTDSNKETLVRRSDHWGCKIAFCAWFIDGIKQESSYKWKKKHGYKTGMVKYSEMINLATEQDIVFVKNKRKVSPKKNYKKDKVYKSVNVWE